MKINRYLVEAPIDNINWNSKDDQFKSDLLQFILNQGFENAAKLLNRFTGKFIKYYAQSAGKNSLSNKNDLFLNFLNNPNASKILVNTNRFTDAYNITYDNSTGINIKYIKNSNPNNCILYYEDFWKNTDKENVREEIISLDIKFFNGELSGQTGQKLLREKITDRSIQSFLQSYKNKGQISARTERTKASELANILKNSDEKTISQALKSVGFNNYNMAAKDIYSEIHK